MLETYIPAASAKDLPSELLRAGFQYWESARGGEDLPLITAADLASIPSSLQPHIAIIDVEPGRKRFTIRLVGEAQARALDGEFVGRYAEDFPSPEAGLARLKTCVAARKPYYYAGRPEIVAKGFPGVHIIVLPFIDPTGAIRRLLSVADNSIAV